MLGDKLQLTGFLQVYIALIWKRMEQLELVLAFPELLILILTTKETCCFGPIPLLFFKLT